MGGKLALGKGGTGNYTLSGVSSSLLTLSEDIGVGTRGSFTQSGGTNTTMALRLAIDPGATAAYEISGGNLAIGSITKPGVLNIGVNGTDGTFEQSAGGEVSLIGATGRLIVGAGPGGGYTFRGGLLSADMQFLGDAGAGYFTHTGGTNNVTGSTASTLTLGWKNEGVYSMNLTAKLNAVNETVGGGFEGTMLHKGNAINTVSGLLSIGGGGGTGTYELSESGVLTAAKGVIGGGGAAGLFHQTGGTATFQSGGLRIQAAGTGKGQYLLEGGTLNTPATPGLFEVLPGGRFDQTGGTFNGYLTNSGATNLGGGVFNGTLENRPDGLVAIGNGAITVAGGILNNGNIKVAYGSSLGSGLTGLALLDNENLLELSGGALAGPAPVVNNATLSGLRHHWRHGRLHE